MSKITGIVDDVIAKTNTNTTDIATIETVASSHIGISGVTAYHLLQGNLAVDNTVTTQGFNTYTYTGTGTAWSVPTGIDMDTQWGNTAEEKFGGLVWLKSRSSASWAHFLQDTVRGIANFIQTNSTSAQSTTTPNIVSAVSSTGFNILSNGNSNNNADTYASWNFQTTHRITGTTNHGKAYTCHYNPFTGFTIVKYEGSGIAGHEIPHHLGRKLGFYTIKNLSVANQWITFAAAKYGFLNTTASFSDSVDLASEINVNMDTGYERNTSSNQYIMYGWANSYFDESNKLIGNYEIGVYQGTGASGNKVKTRGKPAWLMVKRLDGVENWYTTDNQRPILNTLSPNWSNAEIVQTLWTTFNSDGFTQNYTSAGGNNTSGGQYLYMVAYDTNSNGGGSYYPRATDTSNLQVQNAIIPFANGIDANGVKITTLSKNETFSGVTWSAWKNYPYYDNTGAKGASKFDFGATGKGYNGFGDYYDVVTNKWYSSISVYSNDGNNITSWSISANGVISSNNGTITIRRTVSGGDVIGSYTLTGLTIGKTYKVQSIKTAVTGTAWYVRVGANQSQSILTFIATSTTQLVEFVGYANVTNEELNIDSIAVYPIKADGTPDLTNATEISESRNYLNYIVYADNDGSPLYVEELPKIEYKDIVKANEYRGKNACTAWVNFDGTTTPPTIRDSYSVSAVVLVNSTTYNKTYRIYTQIESANVSISCIMNSISSGNSSCVVNAITTTYVEVLLSANNTAPSASIVTLQIFGGKL